MKRKLIAAITISLLISSSTAISVSAMGMKGWGVARTNNTTGYGYSYGMCSGTGYGFMWDEDGNFIDKTTFESRIDDAIDNGWIPSEYKDNYLNMYDYCAEYGAGAVGSGRFGGRGCCGGAMWYYIP